MDTRTDQTIEAKPKSEWKVHKGQLAIHRDLYKFGLAVVKSPKFTIQETDETDFQLGSRSLAIYQAGDPEENRPRSSRAKAILDQLAGFANEDLLPDNAPIVYNKKRRDETFFPLKADDHTGIYTYPWFSVNPKSFQFEGFKRFSTAGCLFGSALKGLDQLLNTNSLIKHDIQFFPTQKFEHIQYDSESPNPYEQMLFKEIENICLLINKFSNQSMEKKELLYHLPYYDYILFGVELFMRGRITLDALNELFNIILEKKYEFSTMIGNKCQDHGIDTEIFSPFENLFGTLVPTKLIIKAVLANLNIPVKQGTFSELEDSSYRQVENALGNDQLTIIQKVNSILAILNLQCPAFLDKEQYSTFELLFRAYIPTEALARTILDKLKIPANEVQPESITEDEQKRNESTLVIKCLSLLKENSFNEAHQEIWARLESIIDQNDISSLEDLFKFGNAFMIAYTARDSEDNETCSILPVTEKQIQVSYQKYCKSSRNPATNQDSFPSVMNLTYLEPLLTHSPSTKGLPFYFNLCPQTLSDLINNKSILKIAHQNVVAHIDNPSFPKVCDINDVLSPMPPTTSKPSQTGLFRPHPAPLDSNRPAKKSRLSNSVNITPQTTATQHSIRVVQ